MKRRLLRIAAGLAIAIVVLAIGAVAAFEAIRSEAGLERVRAEIVERTKELLPGGLSIGRIEGDLVGWLALYDLELRDREGRPAIAIGFVRAEYTLSALVEKLEVSRVEVERIRVQAFTTTAGLNLANLVAPSDAPPEPSPPLSLAIRSIAVRDAAFSLDGVHWVEDLDLSLGLAIEQDRLTARDVDLSLDGARVTSREAVFDLATMELDAQAEISAPAALIARVAGDPAIAGDVTMTLSAKHTADWMADASGTIASTPFTLRGTASPDFRTITARLGMTGIDPHAAYLGAPSGRIDLSALATFDERIRLDLEGRGALVGLSLSRFATTATMAGDRVTFSAALDGTTESATVAPDRVRAEGALRLSPLALEPTRATVQLRSIAPYLPPGTGVDAGVELQARASGPIEALKADVLAKVTKLEAGAAKVGAIEIEARLDGRGYGTFALKGEKGDPLTSFDLQGKLRVQEEIRVDLSRADLVVRGARIEAAPSSVRYLPQLLVVDAEISSSAGDFSAKVSLDPRAPTTAPGTIEIRAPDLSLAGIGSMLPQPIAMAGKASLEAAGRLGPDRDLAVELKLDGVAYRGSAPAGGVVKVRLRQDLAGDVSLDSSVATVRAEVASRVPLDPVQWKPSDFSHVRVTVEPIDLRAAANQAVLFGGPELDIAGTASIAATLAGEQVDAAIYAAVKLEQLEELLFTQVRARVTTERIAAIGAIRKAQQPVLSFDAVVGAPLGDRAPIRAAINFPGFPLAALSAFVEREDAFEGQLVGTASVSGTLAAPQARFALEGSEPRIGSMDFARFRIAGSYAPEEANAEVDLVQGVGGSLAVRSRIRFTDGHVDLTAKAYRFVVDFANDVIPESTGLGFGGRLNGDFSLRGKPEELSAQGWLALTEGRLVPPRPLGTIDPLTVRVKAEEKAISIDVDGKSGDGAIGAQIRTLRTAAGLEIDGKLTTDGLPLAVGKTPVTVDLIAAITGAIGAQETQIDVAIAEGSVEVSEREARELHEAEELTDVVFVDERGRMEQQKKKPKESAPPKPSRTEITVKTVRPLPVESKDLSASVEADIRITSGRVLGKVSLGDGTLSIGGRAWRIERARIDLDGSAPPRPVLDVHLVHEFESVVVSIFVTGTPDQPEVRFEASPATYDQAALLAIVLGANPDQPSDAPLENKAAGAATNYLVGAIRSELGESLWLDTLAVDLGEAYVPKVQLGKWITREIFLGYEHNFGAADLENQGEAILRYRFLPGWMIESRIGDKAQGLDLFWTKRF